MTEFVLGSYRLEVDVEATRAWYGRYGNATGGCGCAYCRNYAAAVGVLPPEAAAFLAACWKRGRESCPLPPASPPGSPQIWDRSSGTSRSPASSAGFP